MIIREGQRKVIMPDRIGRRRVRAGRPYTFRRSLNEDGAAPRKTVRGRSAVSRNREAR